MAIAFRAASAVLLLSGALLAGCAGDGGDGGLFTTGALGDSSATAEAKVDPACVGLTSRIEGLRKEGIADKIEKASAKKYKMTQADLVKADQLTKANAEFQARCALASPKPATAQVKTGTPKAGSGTASIYSSGGTSY